MDVSVFDGGGAALMNGSKSGCTRVPIMTLAYPMNSSNSHSFSSVTLPGVGSLQFLILYLLASLARL